MRNYLFRTIYRTDSDVEIHYTYDAVTYEHTHDFFEFAVTLKGEFLHSVNGKIKKISAGQAVFIGDSDKHAINGSRPDSALVNLSVTPERLQTICNSYFPQQTDIGQLRGNDIVFSLEQSLLLRLQENVNRCLTAHGKAKQFLELIITHDLFKAFIIERENLAGSIKADEWLEKSLEFFKNPENYADKVGLQALYSSNNYSKSQFIRKFNKMLGMTPVEYYTKCKLNYACRLLTENHNIGILSVAQSSGFDSLSHFNRIFKSHIGITPSKFRSGNIPTAKGKD